ncbi:MAG: CDP-alcohol phosphatidyltransferase family protein [Methanomassiliicoccales archaeon]|nr:CDP-alcohol phosphatidyltransferase family protein [Methanomassiliicoccales archaeon]
MVLDSKRKSVDFILEPAARAFIRVDPNVISLISLLLAGLAGALVYLSFDLYTFALLILAAAVILASGFLDALDGKVARLAGKSGRRGDFIDHVIDRYADVLMIGAVAFSAWCDPYLGMLALIGVLLTSYMGTQAQAVGAGRHYAGLLGRADRLVLMVAACLAQAVLYLFDIVSIDLGPVSLTAFELMMLWFAVVGNLTAVQRAYGTWRSLK